MTMICRFNQKSRQVTLIMDRTEACNLVSKIVSNAANTIYVTVDGEPEFPLFGTDWAKEPDKTAYHWRDDHGVEIITPNKDLAEAMPMLVKLMQTVALQELGNAIKRIVYEAKNR